MPLTIDKIFLKDLGKLQKLVCNRVAEVFDDFDAEMCTRKLGPLRILPRDGIDEA